MKAKPKDFIVRGGPQTELALQRLHCPLESGWRVRRIGPGHDPGNVEVKIVGRNPAESWLKRHTWFIPQSCLRPA